MKCYKCALKCHYSDKSSSSEASSLQFYGPARLWLRTYSCQEFLFQNSRWRQSHSSAADWREAARNLGTESWLPGWESCYGAYPANCVCLWQSWKPTGISRCKAGCVEVGGKAALGCSIVTKTGAVRRNDFLFLLPLAGTTSDLKWA